MFPDEVGAIQSRKSQPITTPELVYRELSYEITRIKAECVKLLIIRVPIR